MSFPSSARLVGSGSRLSSATRSTSPTRPTTAGATTQPKSHQTSSQIFSDQELRSVIRNIEDILAFHELFVACLRSVLSDLCFDWPFRPLDSATSIYEAPERLDTQPGAMEHLDVAIAQVQELFLDHIHNFGIYQAFCASQTEATNLVRQKEEQYPSEWAAFERETAVIVAALAAGCSPTDLPTTSTIPSSISPEPVIATPSMLIAQKRKRTQSLSSLSSLETRARQADVSMIPKDHETPVSSGNPAPRLFFRDYLIKPIQRICRYPLLLDQLRRSSADFDDESTRVLGEKWERLSDDVCRSMRQVASAVDEAKRSQDMLSRSALIASRIVPPPSTSSSYEGLTPTFLSSLGACLLSGALDVVYHHPIKTAATGSIKARYLGAFLYVGGYLLLVKVHKGPHYEPKHWFYLTDFTIHDEAAEGMFSGL